MRPFVKFSCFLPELWSFKLPKVMHYIYIYIFIYITHINCFNRLGFFGDIRKKLQKMHYFWQFKDHNAASKDGN